MPDGVPAPQGVYQYQTQQAMNPQQQGMQQSTPSTSTALPSTASEVSTVSVTARIPDFWIEMPRLWFAQFESIMAPQKQGDECKFNLVISKLGRETIQQVSDILLNPPSDKKYGILKQRLLSIYEESAERQFQKLISEMELGDQKPSQLLRKMTELARNANVGDSTLHSLWLQRLPSSVRAVLTVSQDQALDNLAAIADKIMENIRFQEVPEVASINSFPMNELMSQLNKLSLEVAELRSSRYNTRGRGRGRGRPYNSRFRSRSRSRQGRDQNNPNWLCYYHHRFKGQAQKCEQPCAWKNKSENSQ